jgi:hypothetical protein
MHLEITGAIMLRETNRMRERLMAEARTETLLASSCSGASRSRRRAEWMARLPQIHITHRPIHNPASTVKNLTSAPSFP